MHFKIFLSKILSSLKLFAKQFHLSNPYAPTGLMRVFLIYTLPFFLFFPHDFIELFAEFPTISVVAVHSRKYKAIHLSKWKTGNHVASRLFLWLSVSLTFVLQPTKQSQMPLIHSIINKRIHLLWFINHLFSF